MPGIQGQKAPEVHGSHWINEAGKKTTQPLLADYRGNVLVIFCFQHECPGCHTSGFPTIKALYDEFATNENVSFIAIQTVFELFDTNKKSQLRKNQKEWGLPIIMGHDAGNPKKDRVPVTMKRYNTGGTPWIIILNKSGIVIFNDFKIEEITAKSIIKALIKK